jgi:hypothetical protein
MSSVTVLLSSFFFLSPLVAQASLYAPGATLDPDCAPGAGNCGITSTVGTGVANNIPYYAASGAVLAATSTLTILPTGKFGVGTSTPWANFSIGSANSLAVAPLFAVASSSASVATSTLFLINGNGNIGIGTTSPAQLLDIYSGAAGSTDYIRLSKVDSFGTIGYSNAGATSMYVANNYPNNTGASFGIRVNGNAIGNEKLTVLGTGNVGISTSSPYSILSISNSATTVANTPLFTIASTTGGISTSTLMTVLANGNVGIGTTTPAQRLDVYGGLHLDSFAANSFSGGTIYSPTGTSINFIGDNGSTQPIKTGGIFLGGIYSNPFSLPNAGEIITNNSNDIAFKINGSELVRVKTSGLVGIGTTSPYSLLSISNSATTVANTPLFTIASTTGGISTSTLMTVLANGNVGIGTTTPWALLSVNPTGSNGAAPSFAIGSTTGTRFVVTNGGLVGIGTTSPYALLSMFVASSTYSTNTLFAIASSTSAFATTTLFTIDNTGLVTLLRLSATSATTSALAVTGSTTISSVLNVGGQLNANGFVGIGTTTPWAQFSINPTGSNGAAPSLVVGSSTGTRFIVTNSGNVGIGTTSPATMFEVGTSTAPNITFDWYTNCGTFTTNANGLLSCAASDQRLKQDVVPLDAASTLAALNALTPVSFYWKPDADRGTQQQYGFIAQQVGGIFPNLVSTTSPTALTPGGTLTLNYSGLIAPIIVAIQQLSAEVSHFAQSIVTNVLTAVTGNFTHVKTQDLCVGSTCITETQLQGLLQQGGQQVSPPLPEPVSAPQGSVPPPEPVSAPQDTSSTTDTTGTTATPDPGTTPSDSGALPTE